MVCCWILPHSTGRWYLNCYLFSVRKNKLGSRKRQERNQIIKGNTLLLISLFFERHEIPEFYSECVIHAQ